MRVAWNSKNTSPLRSFIGQPHHPTKRATRRFVSGMLVVTAATALVACGTPELVKSWVQGTWSCTVQQASPSEGPGGTDVLTVKVGDGTWTITPPDRPNVGLTLDKPLSGTWTLTSGAVTVNTDFYGFTTGSVAGIPESSRDLSVNQASLPWGDDGSTLSVQATSTSVQLVEFDTNTDTTTTNCVKAKG